MHSVYDLTFAYIQRFYDAEPDKDEKMAVLMKFHYMLEAGWTTEHIVQALKRHKQNGTQPDLDRLFSQRHPNDLQANMLQPGYFYYHNQLRLIPGPPVRELDYNTGEIKKLMQPYFLEMRASFTMDDLVDYFMQQFDLNLTNIHDRKRYMGGFKYLLKTYHIDLILFMIDAASNSTLSEDRNRRDYNPLNLGDYRAQAEELLNLKRTETKLSGDDHIVPRRRVFTF